MCLIGFADQDDRTVIRQFLKISMYIGPRQACSAYNISRFNDPFLWIILRMIVFISIVSIRSVCRQLYCKLILEVVNKLSTFKTYDCL